jgi:hypothetical protein
MSVGHLARRIGASVAATAAAGAFMALAFTASPAGAAPPASGDIVPGTAVPSGTFTPGPFDSGQTINVVIPANSAFAGATTTGINVLECSAPNGVPPTTPSSCDGNTIQGSTIFPNADGSFTYNGYQVFALPDSQTLGEGSSGPQCGNTPATECMLYVGQNQLDFTKPHLWSQPFFINSNANDAGANPGDGTPEVPMAVILPIAGLGLLGGTVLVRNRRRAARA